MPHKNEEQIKQKIVEGRERGVCDRNGKTIPKHKRGRSGKGDRFRPVNQKRYEENYERIFGKE
ncbi:MAG: hypothetical protein ACYS17_14495 [Planctomycetota bacterium]